MGCAFLFTTKDAKVTKEEERCSGSRKGPRTQKRRRLVVVRRILSQRRKDAKAEWLSLGDFAPLRELSSSSFTFYRRASPYRGVFLSRLPSCSSCPSWFLSAHLDLLQRNAFGFPRGEMCRYLCDWRERVAAQPPGEGGLQRRRCWLQENTYCENPSPPAPLPRGERGENPSKGSKATAYFTSKMASISTGTPKGKLLVPMALRAPTPASGPKISANNSLQPLITDGWCVKSDVQFTTPRIFTT